MSKERESSHKIQRGQMWKEVSERGWYISRTPVALYSLSPNERELFIQVTKNHAPQDLRFPSELLDLKQKAVSFAVRGLNLHTDNYSLFTDFEIRPYPYPSPDGLIHFDYDPTLEDFENADDYVRITITGTVDQSSTGPIHYVGKFNTLNQYSPELQIEAMAHRQVVTPGFTVAAHRGLDVHATAASQSKRGLMTLTFRPHPQCRKL